MTTDSTVKIALVAATYRRPDALATLLESIAAQRLDPASFEVGIAVDAIDELEETYRSVLDEAQAKAGFRLVYEFQENAGPSKARNHAIQLTSAPWICIVDDDMELDPGFLAAHLELLQAGGRNTVVIGRVVPEEGWMKQELYEAFRTKFMLEMHEAFYRGETAPGPIAFVTQNVSLARSSYLESGGLDEGLRLGEDTELGFRLTKAGARFVFGHAASAVHRSRIGSYESWLARQIQYGRYAYSMYEKLGRSPDSHPLRNLVTGNRVKAMMVHATCWSDSLANAVIYCLRHLGMALQRIGLIAPAIATHNAIHAVAYHLGLKSSLGSWGSVLKEKRLFLAIPGRPVEPT